MGKGWAEQAAVVRHPPHLGASMIGSELRAARKAQGLSLRELARRSGITHRAAAYWEAKERLELNGHAVQRMAKALGIALSSGEFLGATRARGGVLWRTREEPKPTAKIFCGAKTRKGGLCRAKALPGKCRCKFHGGMSTGPKTPEGRERIADAQRRRWQKHRDLQ